jgi:putative transposase
MRHPDLVLKLKPADRKRLKSLKRGEMTARRWLRLQVLELLAQGRRVQTVADGLGTFPRVVRRVRDEYMTHGLDAALNDRVRPNRPKPRLDDAQKAKIVSIACSSPPEGQARWTLRMLAEEAMRRGIAPKVTKDDVQKLLKAHDLKPWREKNVVRTEIRRRVRGPDGRRVEVVLGTVEERGTSRLS